ncbi:MAG TPA: sigma-54 dependent transcriptional regulator, partial [bacterium]|nr:sigma-54 dependent transcriptional regulator [bacterium]
MSKILIIDDEKGVSYALSFFLGKKGYEVYSSADEKSGLAEIRDKKPDVVLLDLRLQGASGLEILKKIKKIDESIQVIILTGYGKVSSAVEAMKLGAYDYLTKPWKNERVIITIEKALKERELVREVEILKERLKEKDTLEFIGESVSIQCLKKELSRIVSTKVGVLLEGETGTGKEVIAKYIHFMSKRGKSPFVAVDCGALPKELIESELFGYEKGAFTGAEKRKLGKFELAAGGTLFLDEVGNLAPFAQEKLLRVLEEKEIHRL